MPLCCCQKRAVARRIVARYAAGGDCGTGAGGFKAGNTCASGGGGGGPEDDFELEPKDAAEGEGGSKASEDEGFDLESKDKSDTSSDDAAELARIYPGPDPRRMNQAGAKIAQIVQKGTDPEEMANAIRDTIEAEMGPVMDQYFKNAQALPEEEETAVDRAAAAEGFDWEDYTYERAGREVAHAIGQAIREADPDLARNDLFPSWFQSWMGEGALNDDDIESFLQGLQGTGTTPDRNARSARRGLHLARYRYGGLCPR